MLLEGSLHKSREERIPGYMKCETAMKVGPLRGLASSNVSNAPIIDLHSYQESWFGTARSLQKS